MQITQTHYIDEVIKPLAQYINNNNAPMHYTFTQLLDNGLYMVYNWVTNTAYSVALSNYDEKLCVYHITTYTIDDYGNTNFCESAGFTYKMPEEL